LITWDYNRAQWKVHAQTDNKWGNHYFNRHYYVHVQKVNHKEYVPVDYWTTDQCYIMNSRDTANINIVNDGNEEDNFDRLDIRSYFETPKEKWMKPFTQPVELTDMIEHQFTNEDKIILCCDGGLKDDVGSFGMIVSINEIIMAKSKGRVPSTHNKLTS
jgi:hypothetical protein